MPVACSSSGISLLVSVYSRGFEYHLKHLEETLQLLIVAGLKLNPEKCTIAPTSLNFLGLAISPEGVAPNREKVVVIMETPAPRTIKEVRCVLGATGFFKKHTEGYANNAAPLHLILKKGQRWKWEEEQQQAFVKLKGKLATAPVLKQPDFTRPFELHTDASSLAFGAVHQRYDQGAITYYSRKLRDPKSRYPVCEALAVVKCVRVFNPYLYGPAHQVTANDENEIRYKEGPTNYVADLLSHQVAPVDINKLSAEKLAKEQYKDFKFKDILCYLQEETSQGRQKPSLSHLVRMRPPPGEPTKPNKKLPMSLSDLDLKDGILYRLRHLPERVSMDILDVSQVTMKWVLTIVDQPIHFIHIVPMKDITASRVHKAFLDHWVTYFGSPLIIQTDSGRQFQIFNELVELLQSSHHYTIRYPRQANGLVERTNQVVNSEISCWRSPKYLKGSGLPGVQLSTLQGTHKDLDSGKILQAYLNHLRPYPLPLELSYANDAAPEVEDEPVSDNPWVAVLTSCVQDPAFSHTEMRCDISCSHLETLFHCAFGLVPHRKKEWCYELVGTSVPESSGLVILA
ncbi:uncharacterized protein LOC125043064 [Penaeus chinensis]|uniref:uncharacterized protein LOC125043064 n=1 Tax=Penaeus chinensis TaxID=139456 RepID=UPI001FB5F774|nr:uncharacterized protein LOC125043064 [Penaeus chinensis]